MKPGDRPCLCLSFDGVLNSYVSGWMGADTVSDPPTEGAHEFLREAVEHFEVSIYSFRRSHQPSGIVAMRSWCNRYFPDVYQWLYFPRYKPIAHVYIDARAWTFRGKWPNVTDLLDFEPYREDDSREPNEFADWWEELEEVLDRKPDYIELASMDGTLSAFVSAEIKNWRNGIADDAEPLASYWKYTIDGGGF